ncbi:MAG: hypothetical protein QM611_06915 [Microbacterium sp.]|uniref:hypothetical protein n=1 Tax=Microbacterium sp. TaxID=51671 RepID=UPI0039E5A91E
MSDLSALALDASDAAQWRAFFERGQTFAVPLDRPRARRRARVNTAVLVIAATVIAVCVAILAALALTQSGRALTFLLSALLGAAAAALLLRFWLARRRVRAAVASADEYVAVSAEGMRVAGAVQLRWAQVVGGVGFDDRAAHIPLARRPAEALSRAAGVARAELVLGVRGVRELRDAAPRPLRGAFEVIFDHGGVRIPLDTAVEPDAVRPLLAAVCVAAAMSGVEVTLTNEPTEIARRTMAVLGPPPARG